MSDLRAALLGFDGKAISYLSETGMQFRARPNYLSDLVDLARDDEADIASGATWLLKDHLETGGTLDADLVAPLLCALESALSWGAILHILQSVQYLDLALIDDRQLFDLAHQHLTHTRPFIRAWAVDATCRLGERFPARRDDAQRALTAALEDKAASVRARARRISKDMKR